ncbi:MAG: hypothetical protein ACRD4U_06425, partial [Candidatus Acidiferrales bacterium]
MGFDLSSLMIPVSVVFILLIAILVLAFTHRPLADGTAVLTPRRLVEGYVFTVVLAAMLLVSSGAGDLIRAGIADYAGLEASYRPTPVYDEKVENPRDVKWEYDSNAPRRDLLAGTAQLIIGLLVGILHLLGLRRLGRVEPLTASPVYRLFLIVGLVIYTTATLAYAVGSVKDYLLYRYVPLPSPQQWFQRPVPGEQIASLIGFLPLWGLLVLLLFRYARSRSNPG